MGSEATAITGITPVVAEAVKTAPPQQLTSAQAADLAARYGLRPMGVRPPLKSYLQKLYKRRDLVWELADSSAYARNQGSYLGQAWAVLDPLLLAIFYVLVFGLLFPPGGINNVVGFITVGIFTYTFFQNGVLGGAGSILGQQDLIRSHQFPRAVVPIAIVITEAIRFFPAMLVMVFVTWAARFLPGMEPVPLSWRWLLAIPAFLLLTMFVTGMAMFFARICARAPDLRSVLPFFFSLLMLASGSMFPVAQFANAFGETGLKLLTYQPMGVYLQLMRAALLNEPLAPLSGITWIWGIMWAVVSLVLGFLYFWWAEASYGRE
jgi:teichoic acid transport system permease protein